MQPGQESAAVLDLLKGVIGSRQIVALWLDLRDKTADASVIARNDGWRIRLNPSPDATTVQAVMGLDFSPASLQSVAMRIDQSAGSITRRQFYHALANQGAITQQEALNAMNGPVPPKLANAMAQLPAGQQFASAMLLHNQTFFRGHPLVAQLAAALQWTDADVDVLWRSALAL